MPRPLRDLPRQPPPPAYGGSVPCTPPRPARGDRPLSGRASCMGKVNSEALSTERIVLTCPTHSSHDPQEALPRGTLSSHPGAGRSRAVHLVQGGVIRHEDCMVWDLTRSPLKLCRDPSHQCGHDQNASRGPKCALGNVWHDHEPGTRACLESHFCSGQFQFYSPTLTPLSCS